MFAQREGAVFINCPLYFVYNMIRKYLTREPNLSADCMFAASLFAMPLCVRFGILARQKSEIKHQWAQLRR